MKIVIPIPDLGSFFRKGRKKKLMIDIVTNRYQDMLASKISREYGIDQKKLAKVIHDYTRWYKKQKWSKVLTGEAE